MLKEFRLALGLALAASPFAVAQQVVEGPPTAHATSDGTTALRRVSQILGSNVRLEGVDNYGKVEDIVLDDQGTIDYLVVAKDGRYVMLPWNAGSIDYGQRVVVYNVAPQVIQPLFFERSAWPRALDPQYTARVRRVFPRAGVTRRQVLKPVDGTIVTPGAPAVEQRVKVKRNGDIQVKEKVK